MAQYRYIGPQPDYVAGENAVLIVHPGDVWEFPEGPVLGQWEPVEGEGSEKPSEALEPATPTQSQSDGAESAPTGASEPSSTQES